MANTVNGLLTTYGRTAIAGILAAATNLAIVSLENIAAYIFIGKADTWPSGNPDIPTEDQTTIKKTFKQMIAVKQILYSTVCPVVPRFDWTSGTVYTEYHDYDQTFEFDSNGLQQNPFYIRNSYDQIFKCLRNNNGAQSTVEPVLQPGSILNLLTLSSQILYTADGYKWAYLTTIDKGLKRQFFDSQWIPIAIGINVPNPVVAAGLGSVDVINVTNGGAGYSNGFTTATITVNGDGYGATGYANVTNGIVQDVIVTNGGSNYTYATVSIGSNFTGVTNVATANAIVSPIGGTGYDPFSELGCNHLMFTAEFDNNEFADITASQTGQVPIPTNISFAQVGMIAQPILSNGNTATAPIYNSCDTVSTSAGLNQYITNPAEIVYQGTSLASATFTATITAHDTTNNIIQLINTNGTYTIGQPIVGATSGTTRVMLTYTPTIFSVGSGYLMYYENRTPVQRSAAGNEQVRLVFKF